MKHLKKFNESDIEKSHIDIMKSINDLKYIVEDEGYQISTHKNSGLAAADSLIHLRIYKKCNRVDFISPEVEEFIDRLKEDFNTQSANRFYSRDIYLPDTHPGASKYPTVFISPGLNGSAYMDIYISKRKNVVYESSIDKSDILDIIQELMDNGFKSKIQICYCSEDFSPFKTLDGDMRSGYDNKHPGKQSFAEFKGGLKSYLIKLSYKNGVEFEEFENCHSMFVEALDRLNELGKVFKKVHITTDPNTGLIKPTFEILIISKEESKSSLKDQFKKLLNENGIETPFVKDSYYNNCDYKIAISLNSEPSNWTNSWNSMGSLEKKERSKRFSDFSKKIKEICKGKFKTSISSGNHMFKNTGIIDFSPWDK